MPSAYVGGHRRPGVEQFGETFGEPLRTGRRGRRRGQAVQMREAVGVQPKRAGQGGEDLGGRVAVAALLQAYEILLAHPRPRREFAAPQAGHPPPPDGPVGPHLGAAGLEILPEWVVAAHGPL